LTRRLAWNASVMVTSGLARDAEVLTDAGLVLPSATARTSSLFSTFAYQLSRQSNLTWSLSQQGVGFTSATPFTGGQTVGSVVNWSHQVAHAQTLGVSQSYQRLLSNEGVSDVSSLRGTWSLAAGRGWTLAGNGGVQPYTNPGSGALAFAGAMSMTVAKPVSTAQTMGFSYNRGIEQTFGTAVGNHVVQSVSGNYSLALTRTIGTTFSGIYSKGSSTESPAVRVVGETGQVTVAYAVTRAMALSGGGAVYSRIDSPVGRVTSFRTFVSLTYTGGWR